MQCYLEQVYPEQGREIDANLDVVFVHGLNPRGSADHARKTWTHANGTFWPQALMFHSIPSSRVLLYGYNSSVSLSVSGSLFRHHAIQLLDRLQAARTEPTASARPIIFICHSLGGLVVKQALVLAQLSPDKYSNIRSSTAALVFFATPHGGGNGAKAAMPIANAFSLLTGQPRNDLLKMLIKDSSVTNDLTENFNPQKDDYEVRTFFETEFTEVRVRSLRIFPQITSMLVVDSESATYGSSREAYPIPINDNHSGICKFSGLHDPKFATVRFNLDQLARSILRSQGAEESRPLPPSTPIPTHVRTDIETRDSIAVPFHIQPIPPFRGSDLSSSPPVNLTPRIQTSHFLGRDSLFAEMDIYFDLSQPPGRRAAVWGMAGVGKTQFALEFCRRWHQKSGCSVFWVNSQNVDSLQSSFRYIAGELGLDVTDAALSLTRWFKNNNRSLVFFDNVVDLQDVLPFIPLDGVDVLITTRDSAMVGSDMIPFGISIPLLDESEAAALFVLSLGSWNPEMRTLIRNDLSCLFSDAAEATSQPLYERYRLTSVAEVLTVIQLLGCLPLAIVQCASYLREHPMPFDQYLKRFTAQGPDTLRKFYAHPIKGAAYHKSVMTTWDISIERLDTNAVKLVTLLGFLARNRVGVAFLEHALDDSTLWGGNCSIQLPNSLRQFFSFLDFGAGFFDSLGALLSLSLITQDTRSRVILVHPMVHEYIHLRLTPDVAAEWLVNIIALLSHQLPPLAYSSSRDISAPDKAEQVFAHLDRAASLTELYMESIRHARHSAPSLFFLEAYLWYRGTKYLQLAEELLPSTSGHDFDSSRLSISVHPWDAEMVYGARLLYIISNYHSNPGQGLDLSSFDSVVERIRGLSPADGHPSDRPKQTLLQATISYRWIDAVIPADSAVIAKDLHAALSKIAGFSWQLDSPPPQDSSNIDLVSSAIFSHCRVKSMLALSPTDKNDAPESAAAEILFQHREGALFGLSYGCSELASFFPDLLEAQMIAASQPHRNQDHGKLLELLAFYGDTPPLHQYLDRQWRVVEDTLPRLTLTPQLQTSATGLLRYDYFSDRLLTSSPLRQLCFPTPSKEEEWIQQRITTLEKQPATEKNQIFVRRYKTRLAELIISSPSITNRTAQAHRLLEEVFDRRLDQEQDGEKGLSRFGHSILEQVTNAATFRARRSFLRQVASVLVSLGSEKANALVRRWAADLYRILERESPSTVLADMCDILVPWWDYGRGRATRVGNVEMELLDRWGLFISGLPGSTDFNPGTCLDGWRLCESIHRQIQGYLGRIERVREQLWVARGDEYDGMFGRFGSFVYRPITSRDLMEVTMMGVRLQRSREKANVVNTELIDRKFDKVQVEKFLWNPLPATTWLEVTNLPRFVPLPLGRVLGTSTKVVAACYHGPRLGLWVVRETQTERAIMLWTRAEKAGLFYVDVSKTMTLMRFLNSFLILELGTAFEYCIFQLHFIPDGDWRFAANGKQILDQFAACGGKIKDVQDRDYDPEIFPKKCRQYSKWSKFRDMPEDGEVVV